MWIIINTRELVENRVIVPFLVVFSLGELKKDYSLDLGVKVKVNVVKLCREVANCFTINT